MYPCVFIEPLLVSSLSYKNRTFYLFKRALCLPPLLCFLQYNEWSSRNRFGKHPKKFIAISLHLQ